MITIIAFLILLGVLVVIHEGGHFFVLRMCKVHVDRFSVGMGPVIYKKKDKMEMWYYSHVVEYSPGKTYLKTEITFINDRCRSISFFNQ